MAMSIDEYRELWTARNSNLLKQFEQEFPHPPVMSIAQKVKTFEDDPTIFGATLCADLRTSSLQRGAMDRSELTDRLRDLADQVRREVATRAPRCFGCQFFNMEVVTQKDYTFDHDIHRMQTQCTAPGRGANTLVCPDGQLAVKKGFSALMPDLQAHVPLPTLPTIADDNRSAPVKPYISPNRDTPMTASDTAW